jgi:hypothetical protein
MALSAVPKPSMEHYPKSDCPARPFHLWDAKEQKHVPYRFYSDPKRAHLGALIEARWSAIGVTIEVFNANTGRLLGQYTRRVHGIEFYGGEAYEQKAAA